MDIKKLCGCVFVSVLMIVSGCSATEDASPAASATAEEASTLPSDPGEVVPESEAIAPGANVIAELPDSDPQLDPDTQVLVLASVDDDQTQVAAIKNDFQQRGIKNLEWRDVESGNEEQAVEAAYDSKPSLLIIVGLKLLPAVDINSAFCLDQPTITLGGQIAEPTDNVSSVVWPGADGRAAIVGEELPFENAEVYAHKAISVALDAYLKEKPSRIFHVE